MSRHAFKTGKEEERKMKVKAWQVHSHAQRFQTNSWAHVKLCVLTFADIASRSMEINHSYFSVKQHC